MQREAVEELPQIPNQRHLRRIGGNKLQGNFDALQLGFRFAEHFVRQFARRNVKRVL